jgi:hypothetical protein
MFDDKPSFRRLYEIIKCICTFAGTKVNLWYTHTQMLSKDIGSEFVVDAFLPEAIFRVQMLLLFGSPGSCKVLESFAPGNVTHEVDVDWTIVPYEGYSNTIVGSRDVDVVE